MADPDNVEGGRWTREVGQANRHRPAGEPTATYEIEDASERGLKAELSFFGEQLYISEADAFMTRNGFIERCLINTGFSGVTLVVQGKPRRAFRLPVEALVALRQWLDPVIGRLSDKDIKGRYRYTLPLAGYLLITSSWRASALFEILGVGVGLGFAALAIGGLTLAAPWLLLVESVVWLGFGARIGVQVAEGGSLLLLIPAALSLVFVRASLRRFGFYRSRDPVGLA